jgi:ATP-binding cassette, subfamily C (CFTR/MRP), member 4
LKLSKSAQGKTTVGQLINILSNDVNRFDFNLMFLPYIIAGPLQLIIMTYFLWVEFGVSSLAGVGLIVILTPIQCIQTENHKYLDFERLVKLCTNKFMVSN